MAKTKDSAEISGTLTSEYIRQNIPTIKDVRSRYHAGIPIYEKDGIRDEMILGLIDHLKNPENVRYLGLEGPNFSSLLRIADIAGIKPRESLAVERNIAAYAMMHSIVTNCNLIEGGDVLNGLNLYFGTLSEALQAYANKGLRFNVLNLDYEGPLNQEKISTFALLFGNNQVDDDSIMFVTLNNSFMSRYRLRSGSKTLGEYHKNGFMTDEQDLLAEYYLREFSREVGFTVDCVYRKPYKSRKTDMLALGYTIKRID